jgi:phenylpyruvate tautomerase PptA (4-oxalocrotonate tautomerase family)
MPFVQVTWLPKACRTAAVRKEVADAIMKAMVNVKDADISPNNLVVRFAESVDGFPLPKGHSQNPELQAPQKPGAEAFLAEKK